MQREKAWCVASPCHFQSGFYTTNENIKSTEPSTAVTGSKASYSMRTRTLLTVATVLEKNQLPLLRCPSCN